MTSLALSVVLALVSAVCYAAGAILQEHVAATTHGQEYAPVRNPSWWVAVSLNGTGAALHVVALAYGPLSVVQPLGALTIVFALPMAAVFVRRPVASAAWRGAVLATVGLAGLLSLTGSAESRALSDHAQGVLTVVTVGSIVVLAGAARLIRSAAVRSLLLAVAAGAAFGIASVFTKNVTVEWSLISWTSWAEGLPSLVMIALLASAGVLLSQASYRGAGLASPLATATVANPVVATIVGITAFGEGFRHGIPGTLLALAAAGVAGAGLVMLTAHSATVEQDDQAASATVEQVARDDRTADGSAEVEPISVPERSEASLERDDSNPDNPPSAPSGPPLRLARRIPRTETVKETAKRKVARQPRDRSAALQDHG